MYCESSTCICRWAICEREWEPVDACISISASVSPWVQWRSPAAPNHCARRTNWIKTLCLGCSPSERFEHLFMSTLEIKALDSKRLDRCDCEYIAHAAGFSAHWAGFSTTAADSSRSPVTRVWMAAARVSLSLLWSALFAMASHGFWFLGAENAAGNGSQSPNTRKWHGVKRKPEIVFYILVAMRQRNATFIVSWMLKVNLNLEM